MARVVQVDVIDNGIIIQSDPRVEDKEGIEVFVTRDEALNRIADLLDNKIAEKRVQLSDVVLPAPAQTAGPVEQAAAVKEKVEHSGAWSTTTTATRLTPASRCTSTTR
jgi:hypothetical protein